MLESVSLPKNRLKSAKNVVFSLLCIFVDRPMGGRVEPPTPLRTPLLVGFEAKAKAKDLKMCLRGCP